MGNCLTALCLLKPCSPKAWQGRIVMAKWENFSRVCKINTLKITCMLCLWLDKINFMGVLLVWRKGPQWRSKCEMQTPPGSCAGHMGLQFSPWVSSFHIPQEAQHGESTPPPFPMKISVVPKWRRSQTLPKWSHKGQLSPGIFSFILVSCCKSYSFLIYPSYLGWRTFSVPLDIFCFF